MANFPRNSKTPYIDMTPMVDLGFLLIISFILTTILSQPNAIEMINPTWGCRSEGCISSRNYRTVTLLLTETPYIKYYSYTNEDKQILDSVDISKDGLRTLLFEKKKAMTEDFNDQNFLVVFLKASRNAKYKTLIDVIDELKIANASFSLHRMETIDSTALGLH